MTDQSQLPIVMSVKEVAVLLGCSEPTVRKAIRKECDANLFDAIRFCPGGRRVDTKYVIYRAIFWEVAKGRAIALVPNGKPSTPFLKTISLPTEQAA